MSRLANEFDFQSVLYGQVSLAAVNQICVIHDAVYGCKKKNLDFSALLELYVPIYVELALFVCIRP